MNRRAFLATLAGAILGKVVGPKLVAEPTAAAWEAAHRLPPLPVENTYVTLETFCAEVLRIVDEELKWLKLLYPVHAESYRDWRMGDTLMVREPARLDLPFHPESLTERIRPVTIDQNVSGQLDLRDERLDAPFGLLSKHRIEPIALSMAECIERTIKRRGGAEVLASMDPGHVPGVSRSAIMSRAGLSLRGIEAIAPRWDGRKIVEYRPLLRLDMQYGLG